MLHPSNEGRLAVVRWTADSNGTYLLQGLFSGLEGCGYRNVYIYGLTSGATVDFEVDNGGNGYTCDGVGLSALITAL